MKRQRGLSLSMFIFVCFLLVVVSIIGFKLVTPYLEYLKIEKAFKAVAAKPELKNSSIRDIQNAFDRYATIDNITAITPTDIDIEKDGNDLLLTASYSVKVPLVANVSLVVDFNASSAN